MITAILAQWQRLALYAALAAALLSFAWFEGYQAGRDKLDDYIGQQAAAASAIAVKRGKVTERVITEYVSVVVPHTEYVTEAVEKEVVRYAEANPAGLCLDADWRRLHDGAAANAFPGGPGAPPGGLRAPREPAPGPAFPYRSPGAPNGDVELRTASSVR